MPIEFHDKDALITAALTADKSVAFLVGAPLSIKDGVGVPGVSQMLDLAREEIRNRANHRLSSFEDAIRGKTSGDAYQAAMSWLNGNFRQAGVNRVVQAAVRLARKAGASVGFKCDGDNCDWHLPAGTQQLAALICRDRERFSGPILTTNFDPLLSLAIESCHGKPRLRFIQSNGGLNQDAPRTGETEVVHLHGFWRDSDTLHTSAQLTAPRERLKDSLKEILRQKILIVAAYGGWDDVFASALSEVAEDNSVQLDVLWCFRDTDTANIERNYEKLFQRVQPAITRGRFVAYRGIDCHSIFGEIAAALPPAAVSLASTTTGELPPIVGWQEVDAAYLGALPPLTNDEIIRYFDGAVPTWRHAVSPAIPRRQDVAKLSASYAKAANDKTARSMHLIRAAGGEGKSTLLLQAAADAARAGGWSVLWRTSPKEGISPEQVASLDPVRRWLVVADDADNIVPGLADSAYALSQSGRGGVHFLLAARDADWKNARGLEQEWAEWLACYPDIVLRGISPADAKAVVTAWEKAGPDGLRELESVGNPAQRIAAFESAVRDAKIDQTEQQKLKPWEHDKPQKGSFFGGLLAVRFGQNGLQAHVRAFLQRLRNVPIENGSGSLFDALLYVAACHGTGIPGIDERVLADLVGVPRERVQSRVVRPLGEETAAVHSAGHVLTRHSHVAAAILVEAEQALGADLAEVWSQLVRQTVRTSKSGGVSHETHSKILHVGPHLQSALPKQISKAGRKAIAIAAAKASSAAEPERLSFVTDLGRTYRSADMLEQAVTTFRDNLKDAKRKVDFESNIRGYWHEWAVCEGTKNDERESALANVWLSGISLSDFLNPAPLTNRDGELKRLMISCAGLGEAFTRLCDPTAETVLARAHRAAAYLGKNAELDPKAIATFRRHHKSADKIRTGHPHSLQTAIEWFRDGILEAREEITDSFLLDLANPDDLTFKLLETTLENRRASRPPKPYPKRGNWRKKRRY